MAELNAAMKAAADGPLKGVLDYNEHKLVSIDFNHMPASCTFDATQTAVVDGAMVHVLGWYDNEWGLLEPHGGHRPAVRRAVSMAIRTLDQAEVAGRRVIVRVDLNVPVRDGKITDLTRIERLSPTLRELSDRGAKVIVLSHFDRPKGERVPHMSLAPMAAALGQVLGVRVRFVEDCVGIAAQQAIELLRNGEVLVMENTRYHKGEEANDSDFSVQLAGMGDLFVNDAFSAAHRAHASTHGITLHLPAYAGRLMQRELEALDAALGSPQRPVMAVVGGSKVSTKLDLLGNLCTRVDCLVIGGAMANTFLAAQGIGVGRSLQEAGMHDTARAIMARARDAGCEILLPIDGVTATEFRADPPVPDRADRPRAGRCDDPGRGAGNRGGAGAAAGGHAHAGVERAAGRVRDHAVRPRHDGAGGSGGGRDRSGPAAIGRRRRRHRQRAAPGGRHRPAQLRVHGRRGVPGMAGRQDAAGRAGAARGLIVPLPPAFGSPATWHLSSHAGPT